jgi:hypothetical protein
MPMCKYSGPLGDGIVRLQFLCCVFTSNFQKRPKVTFTIKKFLKWHEISEGDCCVGFLFSSFVIVRNDKILTYISKSSWVSLRNRSYISPLLSSTATPQWDHHPSWILSTAPRLIFLYTCPLQPILHTAEWISNINYVESHPCLKSKNILSLHLE